MKQKLFLKGIVSLFLVVVLLMSGIVINTKAGHHFEVQEVTHDEGVHLLPHHDDDPPVPVWENKISDGFGSPSSLYSTRGIEIYNGELYVGTESFTKQYLSFTGMDDNGISDIADIQQIDEINKENNGPSTLSLAPLRVEFTTMIWTPILGQLSLTIAMQGRCRMSTGGELWKYNYNTNQWTPIISNVPGAMMPAGFGNPYQMSICSLKVFNGKLYAGTMGPPERPIGYPEDSRGCQVWRFDGSSWSRVAYWGMGDSPYNVGAWTMEVFNGYLYVGTLNWDFTDTGGAQIYRTSDGVNWQRVMRWGFREFGAGANSMNTYIWQMTVYNNQLYAGTFNCPSDQGAQLWRTSNGVNWYKVSLPYGDGFGEVENYGIRGLKVYNGNLYVGTATDALQGPSGNIESCEIWRYDGSSWTCLVGEHGPIPDGFGNTYNKYTWSMNVCNGKLWVGTQNYQYISAGVFTTQGCEVWNYDGNTWTPVVKNGYEKPNGFGDTANIGARSMMEYPAGSGKLFIGTFNLKDTSPLVQENGCDVWERSIQ